MTNPARSRARVSRTVGRAALIALLVSTAAACDTVSTSTSAEPTASKKPGRTTTTTTTTAPAPTTTSATTTSTTTTTTTLAPTTTTTAPAGPQPPAGWSTLAFADEFTGAALDTTTWQPYNNTYGAANNELECNSPNNVAVANGSLRITARKETVTCGDGKVRDYTSAFLGTREKGRYFPSTAYYEMRAKLPHAQGMWPAFWLRHKNGAGTAEVDIMEYFHSQVPGKTTETLHLDGVHNLWKKSSAFEAPTATPAWHTWGVAIEHVSTGYQFTFFIDGVAVGGYLDTKAVWATQAPTDGTFDIAVNMAVGGNWVGRPDGVLGELPDISRCAQSGTYPGGCTTTGIRRWNGNEVYEVDYVRVWTK